MIRRVVKAVLADLFTGLFLLIVAAWLALTTVTVVSVAFGGHLAYRPTLWRWTGVLVAVTALRGRPVRAWWHRLRRHTVTVRVVRSDIGFVVSFRCSCGAQWWRVGGDT